MFKLNNIDIIKNYVQNIVNDLYIKVQDLILLVNKKNMLHLIKLSIINTEENVYDLDYLVIPIIMKISNFNYYEITFVVLLHLDLNQLRNDYIILVIIIKNNSFVIEIFPVIMVKVKVFVTVNVN